MIRFLNRALLAMLTAALSVTGASAATYNAGDVFLGFRATGGLNSTKDYLVNLGAATQFTNAAGPVTVNTGNIAADLSATGLYGSNWAHRTDLFWALSGTTGLGGANGDPAKTTYVTRARATKTVQSTPWQRDSDTGQGIVTSNINSMISAYKSATANGTVPNSLIQDTAAINSYRSWQPGGANVGNPGLSYGQYNPTIEGSFDATAGTTESVLDFYRVTPDGSGNSGPADYLGFFTISNSGVLTFVPKTSAAITLENSSFSVSEDVQGGLLTINVLRTGDTTGTVSAIVNTANGSATQGVDYSSISNVQVTFGPGETSKPVQIAIASRADYQGDRNFTVTLSGVSNGSAFIQPTTATVTIVETAQPPAGVLSFNSATQTVTPLNGSSQPNSITVTVDRASATSDTVTALVTVTGGSLTLGTDYTFNPNPATVTFAPDETSADVIIPLTAAASTHAPGTITLGLSNPTNGATLGATTSTTITVANVGALSFSSSTYSGAESSTSDTAVVITVNRTGGASGAASVDVVVDNTSTAQAADYSLPATPVHLTWADGDSAAKTFNLTIKSDAAVEPTETVKLKLQNAVGATVSSPSTTTVTILDTDTASPTLTITSPAANAKLSGTNVTVAGTVSDNQGVSRVEVRIDGGAPITANLAGSNWTTTVTPDPGSHFVQVVAYDLVGNATAVVTRSFTFTLQNTAIAGVYNGVILADSDLLNQIDYNGFLTVTVTGTSTFTGKVTFNGVSVSLKGIIGANGVAQFSTKTGNVTALPIIRTGKPDSTFIGFLALSVDAANKKVLGTLKLGLDAGADTISTVSADLVTYGKATKVPTSIVDGTKEKGVYTALFIPHDAPNRGLAASQFPQGQGYGTVTVKDTGAVSITGKLADGSTYKFAGQIAGTAPLNAHVPLFITLYANKGYLVGDVKFDSTPATTDAAGQDLRWFKPAALPGQKNYPNGWPNGILVDAFASKYIAPVAGKTALGSNSGALLDIQLRGASITTENATGNLDDKGTLSNVTSTVGLKLSFLNKTGAISGSFTNNGKSATVQGVVLQKALTAGGYFLDNPAAGATQQSGAIAIEVD